MAKLIKKVKSSLNKRIEKAIQPVIIKQMFVAFKLLNERDIKYASISEFLFDYNSTLKELEYGSFNEEYNSFYNDVVSLDM